MIWEKGPLEIIEMGSCPGFSCFAELALTSDGSAKSQLSHRPARQSAPVSAIFPDARHNRSHEEDLVDEVYPLAAD